MEERIMRIKNLISHAWSFLVKMLIYAMGCRKDNCERNLKRDAVNLEYVAFIEENKEVNYELDIIPDELNLDYKWVGGQCYKNSIYGIPNCDTHFVEVDTLDCQISLKGQLREKNFKWTGGTIFEDKIYGFPRTESSFVVYNLNQGTVEEKNLDYTYNGEHHYAGVCTEQGIVYQPPRNTDHILVTDLKTMQCRKIQLFNPHLHVKERYCGSIIHPNGNAYFFPEKRGKVIKLNLETEEWKFIGKVISTMVFDAKVALNGDIYGYSAYLPGMLHIDVSNNQCEMVHKETFIGSYGTKLGINGKLYSIPGDGQFIWEFDVRDDSLKKIGKIEEIQRAKYAGGCTDYNGGIWGVPAYSTKGWLRLVPSKKTVKIPTNIYIHYFRDQY